MKQLTAKSAKELKQSMFTHQAGKCILCKRDLDKDVMKNHLDHDHALDGPNAGKVRGLLCGPCNIFEGIAKHKFTRTGLESRNVNRSEYFRSLADYWENDYSENDFHPRYIPDMVASFNRLSLIDMRIEMDSRGYEHEHKDTRAILVKKFSKQFRKEQKEL